MSIAKQLSPEKGGSDLDRRYAQLTLDAELDHAASTRTATSLAADVLEARTKRNAHIQQLQMNEANAQLAQARRDESNARAIASEHERLSTESVGRITELDSERRTLEAQLLWARKRATRITLSFLFSVLAASAILVVFLFGAGLLPVVISAAGLVVLVYGLYKWCNAENAKLLPTVLGAILEALGIVGAIIGLVVDFPQVV